MKPLLVPLWFAICLSANAQIGAPSGGGQPPKAEQLPLSGRPQNGSVVPMQPLSGAGGTNSVNTTNSTVQIQGTFQGSVQSTEALKQSMALTLEDAIDRGLKYNLGTATASDGGRQARALRLAAIAALMPDINGSIKESVQQVNLAAQGLRIHVPGFSIPTVVGPFNYFDARANMTETVSFTGLHNWRSTQQNVRAAELSFRDSREMVALAVSGSYLQLIASAARIETAAAQIETANTVFQQATDRNKSGLNAHIDVNRSQVELQTQQQRLTALTNDFEKQKLALARLIGLPMAQRFTLATAIPYKDPPQVDLDDLIQHALKERDDVLAAEAQVKAGEFARRAAVAEYLPSLDVTADYGAIGVTPTNQAHGTFTAAGAVRFPIFRSGRIRADIEQADSALAQRKAEYSDVKGRAEQDVRTAVLDLTAASQQVKVSRSNRELAAETLVQARDRFRAGVSDTVELVQAQESVATAEQDFISSMYALSLARIALARATGRTEQGITRLLGGQ
jgi:outer membrane protein TolC